MTYIYFPHTVQIYKVKMRPDNDDFFAGTVHFMEAYDRVTGEVRPCNRVDI
jgi:hypothetical protein